jgi:hypothetical protein
MMMLSDSPAFFLMMTMMP